MSKMWKKMKKDAEALSPVVATLMLVIVTVAAVAAVAVWYNGWQKTQTSNLGNTPQTQLTLVGSTTVTDLMNIAVPNFMKNNTAYQVTVSGIGSGAGLTAIENNRCDIGMISDDLNAVTAGTTATYPNLQVFTIGYDGVSIFVSSTVATNYGLTGQTSHMVMTPNIVDGLYQTTVNGASYGVPAANAGTTTSAMTIGNTAKAAITTWGDLEIACGAAGATAPWTITGTGTDLIVTHYRSDSSGTQDAFCDKALMAHKWLSAHAITAISGVQAAAVGENGNPAMVTDVLADAHGIGFATTGMISATSGASAFSFGPNYVSSFAGQVTPNAKAVMDGVQGLSGGYAVWHPLNLVTNGSPSAGAQVFINFIMNPINNQLYCSQAGFTSIFQSP